MLAIQSSLQYGFMMVWSEAFNYICALMCYIHVIGFVGCIVVVALDEQCK